MDISKLNSGAWLEVEPIDEKIGTIRLKLSSISMVQAEEFTEIFSEENQNAVRRIMDQISELIVDWNLESEGKKIECNEENKKRYEENKKRYLPHIFKVMVRDEDKEEPVILGAKIIEFAQNIDNFLKN